MIAADPSRFVTAEVGGETFLLDQQNGASFRIGGAGSRMWSLFVEGKTAAEVAAVISSETGADYDRVLADTLSFAARLRENGIG